jgi:hypothetical protein
MVYMISMFFGAIYWDSFTGNDYLLVIMLLIILGIEYLRPNWIGELIWTARVKREEKRK